jgi:predicted nuclease of predicted toxin-antitoxin system
VKLLANENFPLAGVLFLRSAGYDIAAIGVDRPGISDISVMEIAISEQRTILTFDRDYGTLIYKHGYRPSNGVIYLRLYEFRPEEPGEIVHELLHTMKIPTGSTFTVYDGSTIRQRTY